MVAHPNRSKKNPSPARNPRPEEIIAVRKNAGLTKPAAAKLVYKTLSSWNKYEAGLRTMQSDTWELFNIKLNDRRMKMENEFTITVTDIQDEDDRANNECGSITATLTTKRGSVELFEWQNEGEIERTDSHIWVNQKDAVRDLFLQESDNRGLSDSTPWEEIYDSLQAELDKRQNND